MTKTMPRWLTDQLIADGVMTADRVTKHARPRRCHDCGLFTLTGLDDLLPKVVHVDPLPTTTAGEAFALLTGRRSFALDRDELYQRTAGRISFHHADDLPVYVEHECHSPPIPINTRFKPPPSRDKEGTPPF